MRISDWSSDVCCSDLTQGADAGMLGLVDVVTREKVRIAGQFAPRVRRPAGHIVFDEQLHPRRAGTRGEDGSQFGMQRIILLGAVVVLRAQQIVAADRRAEALPEFRRSEEHTSELQSLMRISYAVFCLKKN